MNERIEMLRRVPVFDELTDEVLNRLAPRLEQKSLAAGEILFRLGDPGDTLYIIDHGRLEVFLEISGNRLTLNEMGPGQAVGEMAVIDGKPRSANVIALDETSVYCLDHQSFMDALLQQPPMITVFLTDVAANLRFANTVIEKAAEWSRSVAAANYDKAKVALQDTESEDADRFASFLRAFSAMVTEVQAREEAYQREVQELRIIIDKEKRDRELKAIESSTAFQEIAEQGRRLREARRKRLDD